MSWFDDDEVVARPPPSLHMVDEADERPTKLQKRNNEEEEASPKTSAPLDQEEEDPFEAFMKDVNAEATQAVSESVDRAAQPVEPPKGPQKAKPQSQGHGKGIRDDIEEDDELESYMKFMQEKELKAAYTQASDQLEVEYDSDDNPIIPKVKPDTLVLPKFDHSSYDYPEICKEFYEEHAEVKKLKGYEVQSMRRRDEVRITGEGILSPLFKFVHCGFDARTLADIKKAGFETPTDIQKHSMPYILSGRDVIGVAKTGSGKTLAYVWPMLLHILDQPYLETGDGPIAVICAPTRELADQIYKECKKFCRGHQIRVSPVYGGLTKFEQFKDLKNGAEVVVATPGRLIDLVRMKATNFRRCSYLVLDEADRMLDLGFEPQVRTIIDQVRPDRQMLLFSATLAPRIEAVSNEFLVDPIRIRMGGSGTTYNADIVQEIHIFPSDDAKRPWLEAHLTDFVQNGSVLIFVGQKSETEALAASLIRLGHRVGAIHGDMHQTDRVDQLKAFKDGTSHVLVATDVAARGLDIRSVKTVVCYNKPRNIEAHVHRIGRTGRAGEKGVAHTFVTRKEARFAGELVRHLKDADQHVPPELLVLAQTNPRFKGDGGKRRRGRGGGGMGGGMRGGKGLGFNDDSGASMQSGFGGGASRGGRGGFSKLSNVARGSGYGRGGQKYPKVHGVGSVTGGNRQPLGGLGGFVSEQQPTMPSSSQGASDTGFHNQGFDYSSLKSNTHQGGRQQQTGDFGIAKGGEQAIRSQYEGSFVRSNDDSLARKGNEEGVVMQPLKRAGQGSASLSQDRDREGGERPSKFDVGPRKSNLKLPSERKAAQPMAIGLEMSRKLGMTPGSAGVGAYPPNTAPPSASSLSAAAAAAAAAINRRLGGGASAPAPAPAPTPTPGAAAPAPPSGANATEMGDLLAKFRAAAEAAKK